jgi:hypothetical protein
MAVAMLVTGQAPSDFFYINARSGRIPPNINPDRRDEIAEMRLMMSSDRGYSWTELDRITPDKASFSYSVPADGEYWLQIVIKSKQGRIEPSEKELSKLPPRMKLIVDTKPPELKIRSAERHGDELAVSWLAIEDHPNPEQLKLEYRPVDGGPWTPIPMQPIPEGSTKVRLNTNAAVVVRLSLTDMAGNKNNVEAQVPAGLAAATYSPPAPDRNAMDKSPISMPPLPEMPPAFGSAPPPERSPLAAPAGYPAAVGQDPFPIGGASASALPPPPVSNSAIASTMEFGAAASPSMPTSAPSRTLPELQLVNSREIIVEYEVRKIGPSGLGSVEVWITKDGGAHWSAFAKDDQAGLTTSPEKYRRTLTLPGDGVYGLRLVVKSKAGIGRPAPRPGDLPEMIVEVDTQAPIGKLFDVVPDPQQQNTVLLRWSANDKNLAATPITLEWAEQVTGPWNTIAANVRHTEHYAWRLPPSLPSYVYLRMTIRDNAGNQAIAVTDKPQLVDMSEPEGQFIRVTTDPNKK